MRFRQPMPQLLAINGCFHANSAVDLAVALAVRATVDEGATTETVCLRDLPVGDCIDCWQCTGANGEIPPECIIKNHMHGLLDQVAAADGFILASPANIFMANSLFTGFARQLMAYTSRHRRRSDAAAVQRTLARPALLISSSAVPGLIGRYYYSTRPQLREAAAVLGARPAGCVFVGQQRNQEQAELPEKVRRRVWYLAGRLLHR